MRARDTIRDTSLCLRLPLWQRDGAAIRSADAYGHLCTVTGALWTPRGRSLDGVDDKIAVAGGAELLPDVFTLMGWLKTDVGLATGTLVGWNGASTPRIEVIWGTTYSSLNFGANNYRAFTHTNVNIHDGNWHHHVIRVTGNAQADINNSSWVVDGTTQAIAYTVATGAPDAKAALLVGAGFVYLKGTIGELVLCNRLLTPGEGEYNRLVTKWRYQ